MSQSRNTSEAVLNSFNENGVVLYTYFGKKGASDTKDSTFFTDILKVLASYNKAKNDKDRLKELLEDDDFNGLIENINSFISKPGAGPILCSRKVGTKTSYFSTNVNTRFILASNTSVGSYGNLSGYVSGEKTRELGLNEAKFFELLEVIHYKISTIIDEYNSYNLGKPIELGNPINDRGNINVEFPIKKEKNEETNKWEPTKDLSIKLFHRTEPYIVNGMAKHRAVYYDPELVKVDVIGDLLGSGTELRPSVSFNWSVSSGKVNIKTRICGQDMMVLSVPPDFSTANFAASYGVPENVTIEEPEVVKNASPEPLNQEDKDAAEEARLLLEKSMGI